MENGKLFTRVVFFIIGLGFVFFAVAFSAQNYANFLLGEEPKDLSFGPMLFRVLLFCHGVLLVVVALIWKKTFKATSKVEIEKTSRSTWLILTVLTVAALVLRLWNLNSDLWTDEVFTLLDFARQPIGEILTSFPSQNQHLLYSILARGSINLFGESAAALRLPAVLFGAASIPALFFLCRRILDYRAALLSSALLTVSYHHVWFSQNARGYTGLLFFTLLATWFWFEALERNQSSWYLYYAAAIVGGMWVHLTMLFVVAAHALVYFILLVFPKLSGDKNEKIPLERRAGTKPIGAWFLSATVTVQLYALCLPEFLGEGLHEESRNSEWTNPLWVLTEIYTNLSIGFAGIAVVLIGASFVAFGWFSLFGKNRRAAVLMALPPLFAGSLTLALGHNLFPRFFFFAMGFALIIVVHGALKLPKFAARKFKIPFIQNPKFKIANPIGLALALLMIAVSLTTVPRNYALPKQDFSGAKSFVENSRVANERVVAVGIAGEIYGRYFAPQWEVAKTNGELKNVERDDVRKVWLIYTLSPEMKAFRPELWRAVERDYETVKIFPGTLNGGEIFVCRQRLISEVKNEANRDFGHDGNDSVHQTASIK